MTMKIPASVVARFGDQFGVLVAAHAAALRDWRAHMARVEQDEQNGVEAVDESRHFPYPRPEADAAVASAIGENGEPDYEIEDDAPQPETLLRAKKDLLLHHIADTERKIVEAVSPPGRRRAANLRIAKICDDDSDRFSKAVAEASNVGFFGKLAGKAKAMLDEVNSPDFARSKRSTEDNDFVDAHAAMAAKIKDVSAWAAEQMEAVEDLTAKDVDSWTMAPPPEGEAQ